MPAFVSLAYALEDSVAAAVDRSRGCLRELRENPPAASLSIASDTSPASSASSASGSDDAATLSGVLAVAGRTLHAWLRAYGQEGWTSLTLDVVEEDFDELALVVGRPQLRAAFVAIGARLVRELGVPYVWFDEEAEADHDPRTFTGAEPLFGISLLRADLPALAVAMSVAGARVEQHEGVVEVWRRPDPVPHRLE